MSSSWSVVVLTPTARRVTVKVTRHTTLLQVLEDVCLKVGLEDPAAWDLTHYNRVLDLSLALGSSGVANNGSVEMVAATRVRKEEEVKVGLQVPSGRRLVHSFPSKMTLWGVVEHWRGELSVVGEGEEEVCVYMRRELAGRAELEKTTLRSLGLTHGQAVVRFLVREKGSGGMQANVSSRISVPVSSSNNDKKTEEEPMEEEDLLSAQEEPKSHQHGPQKASPIVGAAAARAHPGASSAPSSGGAPSSSGGGGGLAVVGNAAQHSRPGELHLLGSRDCVLYHGDDVLVDSSEVGDDDDFYRVTVDDVRKMYRDLKEQRERLESSPLQLSSARELERDACVLRLLHDHPETIVRVRFPDRFVLQGVFRTSETVQSVLDWVTEFLADTHAHFYLFTTPPRVVLVGSSRLVEEGLVGMAIVYFGGEQQRPLRGELYELVSAPDAALKAGRDRVNKSRRVLKEQQQQPSTSGTAAAAAGQVEDGVETTTRRPVLQQQPRGGGSSGGVPKWFKLN